MGNNLRNFNKAQEKNVTLLQQSSVFKSIQLQQFTDLDKPLLYDDKVDKFTSRSGKTESQPPIPDP